VATPRFLGGGNIDTVERPVPEPGPGQLLIAVKANALCASERGQFLNGSAVTPGHEAAGVVAAAGPGTRMAPGTPGVIYLMDYCGTCRSCRLGQTNQCLQKRGDMGFTRDGGYGVYEVVNETIFFPVDAALPPAEATLLLDVMGTTRHALGRAQLVHPDLQAVLVMGAGPVGLGMVAMARLLLGAQTPVAVADMVSYRLDLAARLGALPINLEEQTLAGGLRDHRLDAVDAAIDTSGRGSARRAALDALAQRGVLVCVGHGEDLMLTVSPDLIATERAVLGSEYFRYDDLPANLALLRAHRPYLAQIITHRYGVGALQEAFEVFFGRQTGKVVIEQ
jgi:threonine dehydrogenase-like Zn-dependent dehydrogenase